jgi:hypothetical protein
MANQRGTFLKRQREQNLKDKARAKQERLAARRAAAETRTEKGPPIAAPEEQDLGTDVPIAPITPPVVKPPT